VTGNTFTGDNTYNDGVEARFGGSADLKIYHHSSNGHSYVQNATGDLNLTTTGADINITAADDVAILVQGSEYAFVGNNNGAVQLFYDNSNKFETTSAGAKFNSSRVQFHNSTSSGSYIQLSNAGTSHNSASGFWLGANSSSQGVVQNKENTDIIFYTNDTEVARLTADGAFKLPDNGAVRFGGSGSDLGDLRIYHDGSNSYIKDAGAGDLIVKHGTDTGLISRTNGAVELYYDNVKTFFTTAYGIQVQGTSGGAGQITLSADANEDNTDKFKLVVEDGGPFRIQNRASGTWETNIECNGNNNVELYYDNVKKFETTSQGGLITNAALNQSAVLEVDATNGGQPTLRLKSSLSGTNRASRIDFINQDSTSPKWTLINDFDQGGTNEFRLVEANQATGNSIKAFQNGAVELYYDNTKRIETLSTGTQTHGTHQSNKLKVNSVNADIDLTSGQNSFTRYGSINHYHNNSTSTIHNQIKFAPRNGSNGRIYFKNLVGGTLETKLLIDAVDGLQTYDHLIPATDSTYNIGSNSVRFANGYFDTLYGDGSNLTGINTDLVSDTSPQLGGDLDTNGNHILMDDSRIIKFGNEADLQIYHTGNHAYINNSTGNVYIRGGGSIRVQPVSGEDSVLAYANGRVHLYYDNSARLQTESWGARCFGDSGGDALFQIEASSSRTAEIRMIADGGANNPDYSRITKEASTGSVHFQNLAGGSWENNLVLVNNGATEIYHDGAKTIETNTVGGRVKGGNTSAHTEFSIHGNEGQDAVLTLAADDGDDNGDYWRLLADDTGPDLWIQNYADGGWETSIRANGGAGQTELYYDSAGKFSTSSSGAVLSGSAPYSELLVQTNGGLKQGRLQGWASGNDREIGIAEPDSTQWFVRYDKNASSGARMEYHWQDIRPAANNNYDLGSTSYRWRNIYTNDLHLSNEGHSNEVDGTWGNWTIQEGESDLFLKNNRSGKKYKFNLTEVS